MSFIDVSANWIPVNGINYKNSTQSIINLANSGVSIGTLQCLFNSQLNTNGNYLAASKFDVSSNTTLTVDTSNGGGLFYSFIKDGSGILQLNIAQNSFACDISHSNGSINFNTYGDCIYYSKLSGSGTVNKNGSGNLTIINDNTNYTGTINVNSGRLTVNGILSPTSKIIVNNGATLTGSGSVGNVVICTSGNIISSDNTKLNINNVSYLQPLVSSPGIDISYNTNINKSILSLLPPTFVKVTGGYYGFFCYTSANRVYGWGNNYFGNGVTTVAINGLTECVCGADSSTTPISDMITIEKTTYVLFSNGNLYGWGDNTYKQLGIDSATNPQLTPIIIRTNVSKMFYRPYEQFNFNGANETNIYISDTSGVIWGAGSNYYGQLINTTVTGVSTGQNWVTISGPLGLPITNFWVSTMPWTSVYCRASNNRFYAAGSNDSGQLGNGTTGTPNSSWIDISNVNYALSLSGDYVVNALCSGNNTTTSNKTTILLTNNGIVWASGYNNDGQCGNRTNSTLRQLTFGRVTLIYPVSQIYISSYSIYVKYNDPSGIYTLSRWGVGTQGQMGNNTTTVINFTPIDISDGDTLYNAFLINGPIGDYPSSIFLLRKSGLWATGANSYGSLGVGTATQVNTFTKVSVPFDTQTITNIISTCDRTSLIQTPIALYVSGAGSNGQKLGATTSNYFLKIPNYYFTYN